MAIRDVAISSMEYRMLLSKFKLSVPQAGWLFGGKTRTSGRRWAAEGVPFAVALILTLMEKYDIPVQQIEKLGAPYREQLQDINRASRAAARKKKRA